MDVKYEKYITCMKQCFLSLLGNTSMYFSGNSTCSVKNNWAEKVAFYRSLSVFGRLNKTKTDVNL